MEKLVRKNILNIKNYVPGKPIEEVRREYKLSDVVKLASNENCFGPSPKAVAAMRKMLDKVNRYPESSSFYLRKALSRFLKTAEDTIIFGNGSDEVIGLAIRTFVDPGDEIVIASPTFLIYEIASQIQAAVIKNVPLKEGFRYDLRAMKNAISEKTKIVFIANPDNPTGTYVTKKELDEFFKDLPGNVIVFLDEAYFEFADFTYKDYPDGMDYLDRPNVIVARSFSKIYGLAGLRIGYGVASPKMISYMERVREPFNVNLLAQFAAEAALGDKAFVNKTLKHVDGQKKELYGILRDMGLDYVESATNFVLIDMKRPCKEVFERLLRKGVIVRDMKAWGLDTFIRVTIGTLEENRRFVKALKRILEGA
jgi:histidinol-phosphate aminotransferase